MLVLTATAVLAIAAQTGVAQTIVVDRGLPTENVNQITNGGWGAQRSNIEWGDAQVNDPSQVNYPPDTPIMGDDFVLPSTQSSYDINSIRLWIGAGPLGESLTFSQMFNSISLWMTPPGAQGGFSASAAPMTIMSNVYNATPTTYPNGQVYLWHDSVSLRQTYELDFTVNLTYAAGSVVNFGISADGLPDGGVYGDGEEYYFPFVLGSNQYGGAPMYDSNDDPTFLGGGPDYQMSNYNPDGTWNSFQGPGYGNANIQVMVPEPGTLALLGAGLVSLLAYAWRKRK
jgi:hypothetical protein